MTIIFASVKLFLTHFGTTLSQRHVVPNFLEINMPTISYFYGIYIRMFFNDHSPPHFHAVYAGSKAIYEIESLDLLDGQLPNRAHKLVLEWAKEHQEELRQNWRRCESRSGSLQKISPLP